MLTVVTNGIKMIISADIVQPGNVDGMKNMMKVMENCEDLVDNSEVNGCICFGDLSARHQY